MISQTGEYALRAAVYLAMSGDKPRTAKDIADATQVPSFYVSKVMHSLVRAGVASSRRGLGGGFVLSRPKDQISVLDVLNSVDSAIQRITRCPLGIENHDQLCPLHRLIDDAVHSTEKIFQKTTLDQLVSGPGGIASLCGVDKK